MELKSVEKEVEHDIDYPMEISPSDVYPLIRLYHKMNFLWKINFIIKYLMQIKISLRARPEDNLSLKF